MTASITTSLLKIGLACEPLKVRASDQVGGCVCG